MVAVRAVQHICNWNRTGCAIHPTSQDSRAHLCAKLGAKLIAISQISSNVLLKQQLLLAGAVHTRCQEFKQIGAKVVSNVWLGNNEFSAILVRPCRVSARSFFC
jgi:hypothetical protein